MFAISFTNVKTNQNHPENSFLEQEQHYEKHDGTSIIGHETDHELTSLDANQKAIEALQLLLRKLPNKLAVKDNLISTTIDDDNILPETKLTQHITQYNIPKDPNVYVPKFKPIKSSVTSTYTFQLGPLKQITKHTYGGNDHLQQPTSLHIDEHGRKPDIHIHKTISSQALPPTLHTHLVPPSIESISTTYNKSQPPSSSSSTLHTIDAQPLDLYHTMTRKNVENHLNFLHPPVQLPYLPPQKRQIPSNPHHLEIQKSIEYQLQ